MKKILTGFLIAGFLFGTAPVIASPKYEKVLKKWTRDDRVYVWDNLEARLVWHATYLSPEFREARRQKMDEVYEWDQAELTKKIREDDDEARKNDVFFLVIYAGSSKWPEIGKDDATWRIVLESDGGAPVEAVKLERLPVTQLERLLYPFIDHWSHTYLATFPKTVRDGVPFRLRMTGIPAKSRLSWGP